MSFKESLRRTRTSHSTYVRKLHPAPKYIVAIKTLTRVVTLYGLNPVVQNAPIL